MGNIVIEINNNRVIRLGNKKQKQSLIIGVLIEAVIVVNKTVWAGKMKRFLNPRAMHH